jgi:hypothetical protein
MSTSSRWRFHRVLLRAGLLAFAGASQAGVFTHVEPRTGLTIISNVAARPESGQRMVSSSLQTRARGMSTNVESGQFPRVSVQQQKELDGGRRSILLDELANERDALQAATARRAATDVLHRHESNIAALQRELQNTH